MKKSVSTPGAVALGALLVALLGISGRSQQTAVPPETSETADRDFPEIYDTQKLDIALLSPQQAAQAITVPEGFRVSLFAGEPDVQQPIAVTTDARGRLWVAENYTYAEREQDYDTELRDRVVILEDADHDGHFDRRKVFWDRGHKLTSVEIGFGGVWVLCAPELLFIPDGNGDDIPDGPPEVVLDGWNHDAIRHNIVNGLRWGPDGWLYGRHGITASSLVGPPGATLSQRTPMNCGIWRYHPTRKEFEVVAEGTTNPWGFDYDEHGEMFMINTVIGHLWHVVPGSRYRRMFGSHFNSHTYQVMEQTADHFHWDVKGEVWHEIRDLGVTDATDRAGGGHAHSGLMIYLGDNWPQRYRNTLFTANFHGRRLNNDRLEREGNGYVGRHNADFLHTTDQWFRGLEVIYGPDGGVYLLDWSDIGECHENDGVHRHSGRIYKITYGEPRKPRYEDLSALSDLELAKLQAHANDWYVRTARRLLQERAANGRDLSPVADWLKNAINGPCSVPQRLRYTWCLYGIGALDEQWLLAQLDHGDEHVRAWAVRLLVDLPQVPSAEVLRRFTALAESDASGLVRLYLASALGDLPHSERLKIAAELALHGADAHDRMQPLLIWYGIEPAVTELPREALTLAQHSRMPLLRQFIARRLTAEIEEQPAAVAELTRMIAADAEPDASRDLLKGMTDALQGWRKAPAPKNWDAVVAKWDNDPDEHTRKLVRELSVVFGDGRALDELRKIARDGNADPATRHSAIRTLAESRPEDLFAVLKPLLNDRMVNHAVIRALAHCDDASVPKLVFDQYPRLSPEGRHDAVNTLTSRPQWALAMLNAVEQNRIDRSAITAWHARQMQSFGDANVSRRLEQVWGNIRESSAERQAQMHALHDQLTPETLKSADTSRGRLAFNKTCANCHTLYGTGGKNGPDLTGSNRKNLNYLLENIIDPSASVAANFRVSVIALISGRVITGVVVEQDERTLTVQTEKERLSIDRADVEEIQQTPQSLMPDGILKPLSEAEIRDLFAYLMTTSQVPLPPVTSE